MGEVTLIDEELNKLAVNLHNCIEVNELERAKNLLHQLSKQNRRNVASRPVYGYSALFSVAIKGLASWVGFLVDDCCADMEQKDVIYFEQEKGHLVGFLFNNTVN